MLNFDYLRLVPELATLYGFCEKAETNQESDPDVSAFNARRALEWIVKAVYRLKDLEIAERATLRDRLELPAFVDFVNDGNLMRAADYVRRVGNRATHDGHVTRKQAFFALLNLYNFVGGVLKRLGVVATLAPFGRVAAAQDAQPAPEISEAQTRRMFIDLMLNEAGWRVLDTDGDIQPGCACVEVKVTGMPNDKGVGYADYVLFGHNGKPLAVIEAKRTTVDPAKGRHQAELYADCLERLYGVRPVIYFSNGFTTKIIDGLGYPERELLAFHSERDLEWLIQQRGRHALTDLSVSDAISDRAYQKMAIKSLAEWFDKFHRRGLLVMATGTGKTRTAISLVDVLMRNGWVKNVLFLADRTSLVKQAKRNFNNLLPDATICELSEHNSDRDLAARIVFSTYQTMINYVDADPKPFSVGRFDLVIIDEAHRSVFNKFKAIFSYFDSLLVGLTATPRDQIDKSTYDLLGCDNGQPNFAYELDEAVRDGFLVDYHAFVRDSEVVTRGIKYADLSQQERDELEKVWEYEAANADPGAPAKPRDILEGEIYKYIFNIDTIDQVLQDLMDKGLRVDEGQKIGKTIVFAFNHRHAELIVERFNKLYPELGSDFCRVIDNYEKYAQDLIDRFEQRHMLPQIAVSVDMLDTGIDVPDVLNLVFFKRLRSRIKFMQMIGRGTRLCPDIFGPGRDKEFFYIFDWCGNFSYFDQNPKGAEAVVQVSLAQRLFMARANIAAALQSQNWQEDEFARKFHDELKAILLRQVEGLNDHLISVREHWAVVTRFRHKDNWTYISPMDLLDLESEVAPLLTAGAVDDAALRFDLLALYVQLSIVDIAFDGERSRSHIMLIANALQKLASVPQVMAKMKVINRVASRKFWETVTLESMEHVRIELRELMKFLRGQPSQTFVVDIADTVTDRGAIHEPLQLVAPYRTKVMDYLLTHRDYPVLAKIRDLEPLTPGDIKDLERIMWKELGNRNDYETLISQQSFAPNIPVAAFIRTLTGIDRRKALEMFTEFISANKLTADQEQYLKSILDYVCANGDISPADLVNTDPLRNIDWTVAFPGKLPQVADFVNRLHTAITAP